MASGIRSSTHQPTPHRVVGLKKLERTRWAQNALSIIALLALVLMVAFLGMASAGKIHLLAPLYAFSGSIIVFAVKKIFENCYQKPIAEKYNIDFDNWLNPNRPENKKKDKKDDKKKESSS